MPGKSIYTKLITFTFIKNNQITIMVLTMDLSNQAILEVTKGIYKDALAMKSEQVKILKMKKINSETNLKIVLG